MKRGWEAKGRSLRVTPFRELHGAQFPETQDLFPFLVLAMLDRVQGDNRISVGAEDGSQLGSKFLAPESITGWGSGSAEVLCALEWAGCSLGPFAQETFSIDGPAGWLSRGFCWLHQSWCLFQLAEAESIMAGPEASIWMSYIPVAVP